MIEYVKGKLVELSPTEIVVDNNNVGYCAQISLQSFSDFENKEEVKVYIHHILREDEELYYGFSTKEERQFFRLLISVSGIGANTARMMLSSLNSDEITSAILSEDINKIKSIKGIGLKTAQRLILELKDKVAKGETLVNVSHCGNQFIEEATTALVMLGFTKANVTKAVTAIIKKEPDANLENIIKLALKML